MVNVTEDWILCLINLLLCLDIARLQNLMLFRTKVLFSDYHYQYKLCKQYHEFHILLLPFHVKQILRNTKNFETMLIQTFYFNIPLFRIESSVKKR